MKEKKTMPPKCIMLCGLPASGKSTEAKKLSKLYEAVIISSDELRIELFNDVNFQKDNNKVFSELNKRVKSNLKQGRSVIIDSTNISYKRRKAFLQELTNFFCEKICVVMATPYEECLRRNVERERQVPEHVLKKMYMNFSMPWYYEGWDNIEIQYAPNTENSFGSPKEWIKKVIDFNQDNPHHGLTLGQHCLEVSRGIFKNINIIKTYNLAALKYAGMLHDEGKVFTKTFIDSKGNLSDIAHYYQHHCCSCYDSLFFEYPANHLYVAVLIYWHMQMHFNQTQKTMNKYKQLWGEVLYEDLIILHEADKSASKKEGVAI